MNHEVSHFSASFILHCTVLFLVLASHAGFRLCRIIGTKRNGAVAGTVKDASGVAGAKITITDVDCGTSLSTRCRQHRESPADRFECSLTPSYVDDGSSPRFVNQFVRATIPPSTGWKRRFACLREQASHYCWFSLLSAFFFFPLSYPRPPMRHQRTSPRRSNKRSICLPLSNRLTLTLT